MRAISVQQPWAWAILCGGKDVENRTDRRGGDVARKNWASAAGTTVLIHASQRYAGVEAHQVVKHRSAVDPGQPGPPGRHPEWAFGGFAGVVDVVGVHTAFACEDLETGRFCSPWAEPYAAHLVLENPRVLFRPIDYPGRLGLWEVEDSTVLAEVRRCLS